MWEVRRQIKRSRRFIPLPEIYPFSPSRPAAGSYLWERTALPRRPRPSPPEPHDFRFLSHGAEVVDLTLNAIGSLRQSLDH